MRIFNDAFEAAVIHAPSADIRFTIEVQWDEAGTELVYFLSHEDSGAPIGATTIHSIHSISSTSQSLNNRYAIAEIGSLSFMLADVEAAITEELSSRFDSGLTPVQKKCTVYMGTKDLDWTDYEPVDTWFIDDVDHTGPGYRFRGSDIQRLMRQKIFTPDKSRLSASMTSSQMHIPLTVAVSSTKFPAIVHDSSYDYNPSATVGYVKIDDEIIAHDGTFFFHSTDGPSLGVIERHALNTKAAAHSTDENADEDKGKEVEEVIYIQGKVVDVLHMILTGENIAGSATIPDHWNAGIDPELIETDSYDSINTELSSRSLRFIRIEEQDAKQFAEQQCMRFFGLFQTVTSLGKLKLNRYERTIQESSPVAYIDSNTLIDVGELSQKSKDVINVYTINYNWDYLGERTTRSLTYLDATSYGANGNLVKNETFEFRGVHTALHSDNDVRNFIYQTRELFSNPPYKTRIKVNRKMLGLVVGDVINLETAIRKDYVSGSTTLNRPFMVTRRSVELSSGETTLELIGTGLKAEAVLDPDAVGSNGELEDSFLTGTGTDLESLPQVTAGVLTSNLTLTGTSNLNASASIWYLDGDLVIPNGKTLTLGTNVQLRVTGEIVVQNGGKIDGKGNGRAGAAFGNSPTRGYFGATRAGAGEVQAPNQFWYETPNIGVIVNQPVPGVVVGTVQTIPFYNLTNADGTLTGLPNDLRGTPGGPGGAIGSPGTGNGGNGANSGAGFITISRGLTIEPTGIVDLSGNDGTAGAESDVSTPKGPIRFYGGGGGGGCPGGWLCIIDGDFSAPTSDQVTANRGNSPFGGRSQNRTGFSSTDMAASALRVQYVPARKAVNDDGTTGVRQLSTPTGLALESGTQYTKVHEDGTVSEYIFATWDSLDDAAVEYYQLRAKRTDDDDYIVVAIIPEDEAPAGALIAAEDGIDYSVQIRAYGSGVKASSWSSAATHTVTAGVGFPSDVTGFQASQNGSLVNFFWKLIPDANRDGYLIRYGPVGVTWENATPLLEEGRGTKVTSAYVPNGEWDFLIKAINLQRKISENAARSTLTVLGLLDVISQVAQHPAWLGTLSGYWKHYSGRLVPLDENPASFYGWELFDTVIPNPVPESSYETEEQDGLIEGMMRISAALDSELAPDTTGIANPIMQVDYRGESGSYDGFEDWEMGEVVARYAKFRIENDNTLGAVIINSFTTILDAREREEKETGITVAPGGTAIVFDQEFRNTPYIEVGVIGGGGLIAESAGDSTTGFTFHIYNSSGTSIGGTGKWKATGV